jgi:hypothetical protein
MAEKLTKAPSRTRRAAAQHAMARVPLVVVKTIVLPPTASAEYSRGEFPK